VGYFEDRHTLGVAGLVQALEMNERERPLDIYPIGSQDLADEAVAVSRAAEQALCRIRSTEGPR